MTDPTGQSEPTDGGPRLLVVRHSTSGGTQTLSDALIDGARAGTDQRVEIQARDAFEAGSDHVMWAHAVVLATPANFGYMSGALKDFFDRTYLECLDKTVGKPWALVVKGSTDAAGAVASVERIVAGLRWRAVLPPLVVVGSVRSQDLEQAYEMGGTLGAGLELGIF